MTIRLDEEGRVAEIAFEGKGCAISTAATSLLTDELTGKTREELLRLPKEFVLELLGIDISATRMKCAMLGLKVVKSASLGQPAEWEDEPHLSVRPDQSAGTARQPEHAARRRRSPVFNAGAGGVGACTRCFRPLPSEIPARLRPPSISAGWSRRRRVHGDEAAAGLERACERSTATSRRRCSNLPKLAR